MSHTKLTGLTINIYLSNQLQNNFTRKEHVKFA